MAIFKRCTACRKKRKESQDLAVSEPPPDRKFQENWKKDGKSAERLCLLYENGKMFCASCRMFSDDKNNTAQFVAKRAQISSSLNM